MARTVLDTRIVTLNKTKIKIYPVQLLSGTYRLIHALPSGKAWHTVGTQKIFTSYSLLPPDVISW